MNTFVILTPPGHGAIGVIRVQGETCAESLDEFFVSTRGILVENATPDRLLYGKIMEEDVVICRTAEDVVEIHSHGSPVALRRIAELLASHGMTELSRESYLQQQYGDAIQTLAQEMLSKATTWRTSRIILDQYNGALQTAIMEIDREPDPDRQEELRERLFRWSDIALHLVEPWKVAIVGPPNAGKSALFNALLGFSRVLVHDEAGTTRDVVRETITFDGWCFELIDTAGLRDETDDEVEREGILRARKIMDEADLVLCVYDATALPESPEEKISLPADKPSLILINKCDLCAEPPLVPECPGILLVSALDPASVETLADKILEMLVPEIPPPGTAVPIGLV